MKLFHPVGQLRSRARGFTIPEILVAASIGSILLAALASLSLFGARSFAAIANYVDLDAKSRNTLDVLSRQIRNSTALTSCQTNQGVVTITLTNASAGAGTTITYTPSAGTLVYQTSGQSAKTNLTQVSSFNASFYSRAPVLSSNNIAFMAATNTGGQLDPNSVKLICLSWKASRWILGASSNTESLQMAQVVLRNKM